MANDLVAFAPNEDLGIRVRDYWKGREQNGNEGLRLLDSCIKQLADKNKANWDPLARFVVASMVSNNRAKVVKIIRAAFGNDVSFKLDKKHAAGGTFTIGWKGNEGYVLKNTYALIQRTIDEGKGWDDAKFLKELTGMLPEVVKKKPVYEGEAAEKAVKAAAKHIADSLKAKVEQGLSTGDILAEVERLLKAA